jgi:predicted transcriptional regulator
MSVEAPPMSDKELAMQTLRRMPETASLHEISEAFAILAALRRATAAADAGHVVPHEEVKRRSAAWTTP